MKTLDQLFREAQDELLKADVLLVPGQAMERCGHCHWWQKRHKRSGVCTCAWIVVTKKDGAIETRYPVTLYSDVCVSFAAKEHEAK